MTTVRWIRPSWLTLDQALIYSSLPFYVLDALVSNRRLRTRASLKGRLIQRNSIDRILLESIMSRQPVLFGSRK